MKKVLAWLLVLALTAAVSIGATLAYLTDTDEDVNVMTLGKVKIDQLEYERVDDETANEDAVVQEFHDNKPIYPAVTEDGFDYTPGDTTVDWTQIGKDGYSSEIWDPTKINNEIDKMVFVKNKGDYDAYVRSIIAFEANGYTLDQFKELFHLNLNGTDWTWEWVKTPVAIPGEDGTTTNYVVAVATYNKILEPGKLTEISLSQIALDSIADNEDIAGFGDTYQVLVKTQAIQAQGFTDPDTALNEGFGEITAENIPFETDSPIKGIDLRTALHNLNGNTANPITTKVTNVIFALNEEYPEIVDGYEGTLVDVEQDVDVYAYYVPNGSNYDVYFLADDVVFTPKDSSGLFKGMTALQTVDTHNMDVSRTENMFEMFLNCKVLTTMDVSHWDTGSSTHMGHMFRNCAALNNLELSGWNTSNVTDMTATFYNCDSMTELDMADWDVGKVQSMYVTIYSNDKLQTVDISGWNADSVTDMRMMIAKNPALRNVDVTDMTTPEATNTWAMFISNSAMDNLVGEETLSFPKVENASCMFEYCNSLPEATVDGWDMSSVKTTSLMFDGCTSLKTLEGSETWRLDSVEDMSYMFQNCNSLEYLDATGWNMENCVNMDRTFMLCHSLETVEGSETWNTGNVQNMYATFYDNKSLTDLDTSTWDTGSVTTMQQMFRGDVELKTLDVSNWDVSNVTSFGAMFGSFNQNKGDMKLEYLDLSDWNPASVTSIRHMFYGCGQLKEVDMSGWDVSKLQDMSHMFADCYKLEKVDFTGWNTPSLTNMDAIFNNCEALKSVDMSTFDTSNVTYFSQLFEACYSLEEVIGLENWDTSNGDNFSEMFSGCSKLKELDLTSFDTRNANHLSEGDWVFLRFISGCTGLEKITFGPYFDFDGVGCADGYKFVMTAASGVEGWDGHWYNAETGEAYLPAEIPELTAATYLAVKPTAP